MQQINKSKGEIAKKIANLNKRINKHVNNVTKTCKTCDKNKTNKK